MPPQPEPAPRAPARAAPAPTPPWLRPAALFLVLLTAKAALCLLRAADGAGAALRSPLLPLGLLQEDAAVSLGLLGVEYPLSRVRGAPRLRAVALYALYAALCIYAAANVPVARVFGTPLTYPILRAAGGALSDSLAVYITPGNVLSVLAVLLAAVALPPLLRRAGRGPLFAVAGLGALALLLGGAARAHTDTGGLHRSAALTLLRTTISQRAAAGALPEVPPLPPEGEARDLGALRGAARGRSVLWILLESTAAQYLRPYGAAADPMPTLSALGARGLVFESVYAAYPESIKGLYSMLCAAYPAPHTDAELYAGAALPCDSVAERLRAAGYKTGLFHSGWFPYLGMAGVVQGRGFDVLMDAGTVGGRYATSFGTDEQATVARVLAFLDGLPPGAPFFAMYLPIAGHHPYESPGPRERPRPFGEGSDLQRYQNDLRLGDQALGELLDGMRRRGLLERTLLVVSGDHGEAFYQHPGNFAHTLHLYEENLRVPLVIAGPGVPALRAPQVGAVLDVAPTILALLGEAPPPRWQGRSLLDGTPGLARFFTDHAMTQLGLRQGRWKLIHDQESGRSRLFDLAADPGEERDLAAAEPARAGRYREHLQRFFARQRALLTVRR